MIRKVLISDECFGRCGAESFQMLLEEGLVPVLNPFGRKLSQEEVVRMGKDCIGIIAGLEPLNTEVLEKLSSLRCISRCGTGLDNIDMETAERLGIAVTSTPDETTRAVAELTIGLIMDIMRGISLHDRKVRSGSWQQQVGNLLLGKRVGVLGLGRIGRMVAEMLIALKANVVGTDIEPDQDWLKASMVSMLTMEQLIKESEILTIHISYKPENRHLIGQREIGAMRTGAYLVNMSRGGVVDEDALYESLTNGHLRGAALDVFSEEPYSGRLCQLDNVVLTPHIGTYTRESRRGMEKQAVINLIAPLRQ